MTTTKERAAMQQALDALDILLTEPMAKTAADKAEALLLQAAPALREALAEPDIEEMTLTQIAARHEQAEQEPVAWWHPKMGAYDNNYFDAMQPLYLSPVRTKDLTDDEIEEIGKSYFDEWSFGFARAVIAADREKNK